MTHTQRILKLGVNKTNTEETFPFFPVYILLYTNVSRSSLAVTLSLHVGGHGVSCVRYAGVLNYVWSIKNSNEHANYYKLQERCETEKGRCQTVKKNLKVLSLKHIKTKTFYRILYRLLVIFLHFSRLFFETCTNSEINDLKSLV